jgi:MarR family transcriptional regulator, organic hydroperoxide resistance regulator
MSMRHVYILSSICNNYTVQRPADVEAAAQTLQRELRELVRHVIRTDRGVQDDAPLTATQRLALSELADAGPMRLHELAGRMATTPATASRSVDALVAAKLVERVADRTDRRAVRIDVTRRGRARIERRRAEATRALLPALARMPERERMLLVRLITRLNSALDAGFDAAA